MSAICQQCHRLDKYCACNVSLSPLTEQARAAEQPMETLCRCPEGICGLHPGAVTCSMREPTQPPAGNVVERMLIAYHGCKPYPDNKLEQHMTAALAVAREGYVSLDDVEKVTQDALRKEADSYYISDDAITRVLHELRARLAKPAEQTDEQKVVAILAKSQGDICTKKMRESVASEIVAALKAGKHD